MKRKSLFALIPLCGIFLAGCTIEDGFSKTGDFFQKCWDHGVNLIGQGVQKIKGEDGHIHSLSYYPEVAPTRVTDGHKAYYACNGCDILLDENKQPTTWEALVIPKLG